MTVKTTCSKCDGPIEPTRVFKQRYCRSCHAENMRLSRPRHSELSELQKKKANARSFANVYQRREKLIPKPCEKCGEVKVEKHHEDYSKPTEVNWLCRPCHMNVHKGVYEIGDLVKDVA